MREDTSERRMSSTVGSEIVLKGGRLIDPASGLNRVADLRIVDGRITELGESIFVPSGAAEYRLGGTVVTPGLIDFHAHVYRDFTTIGEDPDVRGVSDGVTTVVDAGSAGAYTFPGFRRWVVDQAATRVLCFLNYGVCGLIHGDVPEASSEVLLNDEATLRTIEGNRDVVKGVKVRALCEITGAMGIEAVRRAKQVARRAGVPLVAHIGGRPSTAEGAPTITAATLDLLEAGDILVHPFTSLVGGLFDRDGKLLPQVHEARIRGVKFDVASGSINVSFPLVRAWLEQGLPIDIISSDATLRNRLQRVFSLPVILSKFLALGLSLDEVLAKATLGPARALGLDREVGLRVGAAADISVLELLEGEWPFVDSDGKVLTGGVLLSPVLTVRAGRVYPALRSSVHPLERYSRS